MKRSNPAFGNSLSDLAEEHADVQLIIDHLLAAHGGDIGAWQRGELTMQLINGGRSGARVLMASLGRGSDGQYSNAPVVLKVGPAANIMRERDNFHRFVRWQLPRSARPQLFGWAKAGEYSGLCYSLIGDFADPAATLTELLESGATAAVEAVLKGLLAPLRDSWYGPQMTERKYDIARYYRDKYFSKFSADATEEVFRIRADQQLDIGFDTGRYAFDGQSVPALTDLLFRAGAEHSYQSCIIHGDLNSDNVLVNRRGNSAAMVDFQKTGRGHVYEDWIAVEASVRINLPPDEPLGDVLRTERLIVAGYPPATPYASAIVSIRETAAACLGMVEVDNSYHFGVAAIGLRLMQARDLSSVAQSRIIASTLWAARALEEARA